MPPTKPTEETKQKKDKEKDTNVDLRIETQKKKKETEEISGNLTRLEKRLRKIKKIYYELSLNSEFQNLLLESKIHFQQQIKEFEEHLSEKHSKEDAPIQQRLEEFEEHCQEKRETETDPRNYFNFLIQEEMNTLFGKKLDFTTWLIMNGDKVVNHEKLDKILQITRKTIEDYEDKYLDLNWIEITDFFSEPRKFRDFVWKEKQNIEDLNCQLREKQDFLNSRVVEGDFKHGNNNLKDQIETAENNIQIPPGLFNFFDFAEEEEKQLLLNEPSFSKFIFRLDTRGHKIFWSVLSVVIISVPALLCFYWNKIVAWWNKSPLDWILEEQEEQ